jgi:hypothetical protein
MTTSRRVKIELSRDDVLLLCEALDSHVYWQLSEPECRQSGFTQSPGTLVHEDAIEIRRSERLEARLRDLLVVSATRQAKSRR